MAIYETHPAQGHEFENLVFQDYYVEKLFDYTDLASGAFTKAFPLEEGVIVLGCALLTTAAFTGTAPVVEVGDASDANGFLATTDVDITTVNTFATSEGSANAYAQGKYYPSGGSIIVDANEAPTAGAGKLLIHLLKLDRNWRLPAAS